MQKLLFFILVLGLAIQAKAQLEFDPKGGSVSGNFKLDAQSYTPDEKIGADTIAEKMLSNSYMNVIYKNGNFTAGVRFEGYFNTMLGYNDKYDGFGLASRYATYTGDFLEITAGNFYDQFGNGLVFRTYEEKDLGYDNAMDGMRVKVKPVRGVTFTGIIGNQRLYWDKGEGIVRGIDGDFSINDIIPLWAEAQNRVSIGGSFVSKYQEDNDPLLFLPLNTAAGAARLNFTHGNFNLGTEYAYKSQDPSADNGAIYKNGSAWLINANYSIGSLGLLLQYKWVDNMSFRSERNATEKDLSINYLPAITKNHAYSFAAMYPYATQMMGESGIQSEVFYNFKKETLIGGKYGTLVTLNYARINDIERTQIDSETPIGEWGTDGYNTKFLSTSDSLLNQDFGFEITKKISKSLKGIFTYQHVDYNIWALQGHGLEHDGMVNANTFIADITWRIKPKHSLRFEAEALVTKEVDFAISEVENVKIKQDFGNWAMLMLEYSVSPHWFFAVSDQFNYISTNDEVAKNTMNYVHNGADLNRNHYFSIAGGYSKGASRIQVSYGKQREGIVCVGGVCRAVPAAYGFNISLSSTF